MIITWCGHSCFKIQDKLNSDGVTLTTDPFDKKIGLKPPAFESDIVTVSHDHYDHNNTKALRGDAFVIDKAGEYDLKGVAVHGVESFHDKEKGKERGSNIIYKINMDNITVAHLGDLGHELNEKQLEVLVGIDILLIPVGGKYTLNAKQAVSVVGQIEPRIVIPMHYKLPGLNIDLDGVEKFVKELGIEVTKEAKLRISKKDLPQEDMELVILDV